MRRTVLRLYVREEGRLVDLMCKNKNYRNLFIAAPCACALEVEGNNDSQGTHCLSGLHQTKAVGWRHGAGATEVEGNIVDWDNGAQLRAATLH